jgi:hypothetical protein
LRLCCLVLLHQHQLCSGHTPGVAAAHVGVVLPTAVGAAPGVVPSAPPAQPTSPASSPSRQRAGSCTPRAAPAACAASPRERAWWSWWIAILPFCGSDKANKLVSATRARHQPCCMPSRPAVALFVVAASGGGHGDGRWAGMFANGLDRAVTSSSFFL